MQIYLLIYYAFCFKNVRQDMPRLHEHQYTHSNATIINEVCLCCVAYIPEKLEIYPVFIYSVYKTFVIRCMSK